MSSTLGPESPVCVQSVLPVNDRSRFPPAARSTTSAGSVRPENPRIQCSPGSTSGTSAGTIGSVIEWPRPAAIANPAPSDPDFGSERPPVQRMIRAASIEPASVATQKPPAARSMAVTRAGWTSAAPAAVAAPTSASSTVRAESVTGKSLPVSSRFRSTPHAEKNLTVSSTVNRPSTLRIAGGVLPA